MGPNAILDPSGNAFLGISSSTSLNFTTSAAPDTSPPILTGSSPADNASGVATNASIVLTFNEVVVTAGAGTVNIHRSDGSLFQSISILDPSQVTFFHNTITINPSVDLAAGTDYYVTVSSGAIRDIPGNLFGGISSSTTLNLTTQPAPNLPPPPNQQAIFLSIVDNSVVEGTGSGTTPLTFGVTLTGPGAGTQTVAVQYTTEEIPSSSVKADSGFDFVPTSGVLVIPAGQTFGTITVPIQRDTVLEPDEVFRLTLSQPSSGVTLLNSAGQPSGSIFATGFIINDESAPNHHPVPNCDLAITSRNTPIVMDVLANDSDPDGDPLHISFAGSATNATVAITQDNKNLVTPNANFEGIVSFFYTVHDGHPDGQNEIFNQFAQLIVSGDGSPEILNTGTIGDDIIVGGAGNDTLSGGFGDDIIAGGPGADRIDGGPGFDYLDLRQAAHGANFRIIDPWVWDDGDGGQDILKNVEGVLGSRFDDIVDGSSGTIQYVTTGYRFYGNDGNDRLQGDAGDDILDGGAGDDTLIFGAGRDNVFGGTGNDLIYSFTGNTDTVGDHLDGGPGDDTVDGSLSRSPDTLVGGSGNDHLLFSDGDTASGGDGVDTFRFGGFSPGTVYQAWITDLSLGAQITWNFVTAIVSNGGTTASWFDGPIRNGSGATTGLDQVEYATVGNVTNRYFGYDATPGADFILSLVGIFSKDQFQVDTSGGPNLAITVRPPDVLHDFNGDGTSDILWRNDNGIVTDWLMNNGQYTGAGYGYSISNDWHVAGTGDFNGNGTDDILWRNDNGIVTDWLMNDGQYTGAGYGYSIGNDWHVAGTGDFNGDGTDDILWRNDNGIVTDWLMNNGQYTGTGYGYSINNDWHVAGTGDFNGNGTDDILWRNDSGIVTDWLMNNGQYTGLGYGYSVANSWHIEA